MDFVDVPPACENLLFDVPGVLPGQRGPFGIRAVAIDTVTGHADCGLTLAGGRVPRRVSSHAQGTENEQHRQSRLQICRKQTHPC